MKIFSGFALMAIAFMVLPVSSCKNKQANEAKLHQLERAENIEQDLSKIIYLSHEGEKQNLWIMNTDGSEKQQLSDPGFSVQWACFIFPGWFTGSLHKLVWGEA